MEKLLERTTGPRISKKIGNDIPVDTKYHSEDHREKKSGELLGEAGNASTFMYSNSSQRSLNDKMKENFRFDFTPLLL